MDSIVGTGEGQVDPGLAAAAGIGGGQGSGLGRAGGPSGFGDDLDQFGSEEYTPPVRDNQGNITNPYPDGFFSRIFGAENVDYRGILGTNINAVEDARRARFFNTGAVSKGFGSLFGGAEGEMTVAGPRVAQIAPLTAGQTVASGLFSALGLPVGLFSRAARTTYAPEGFLDPDQQDPSTLNALSEFVTGVTPEGLAEIKDDAVGKILSGIGAFEERFMSPDDKQVINSTIR